MQETRVRFLGQEDSSGEGNGNPLQYSCLENPMLRGAWWATVHGVTRVGHNIASKSPPPIIVRNGVSGSVSTLITDNFKGLLPETLPNTHIHARALLHDESWSPGVPGDGDAPCPGSVTFRATDTRVPHLPMQGCKSLLMTQHPKHRPLRPLMAQQGSL